MATDNPHGLVLYDYGASPCARRCRISMHEKGLAWETQIIDLSRLEQRDPAYLRINPNGFVPALAHGERVIYESNVITEYLDDLFPDAPLYPSDPWELAQVKMWQSAELAMAKDYRPLMYQRLMGPVLHLTRTLEQALGIARRSTTDPADLAWEVMVWRLAVLTPAEELQVEDRLRHWLDVLERSLDGRDYLVGDRFTQAEISIYPRVMMYAFVGIAIDRKRWPNVARWMDRLAKRPSFARTLTPQDKALLRLAGTPTLGFLGRVLRKSEAERTWTERARVAVLRRLLLRATRERGARAGKKEIHQPRNGSIAPAPVAARRAPAPPRAVLAEPLTLHDDPRSPHGRRIRILLAEKGLAWTTVAVDLARMEHKTPEHLAINPNGELPALRHAERTIYDSQLIAEYVDRTWPLPPLYPADAYEMAQVRMWLALEAGTHKEFRPLFWLHVMRPELLAAGITAERVDHVVSPAVHPSHREWLRDTIRGTPRFDSSEDLAREIILKKLDFVERGLERRDFLVGDALTMADVAWYTRIDLLPTHGIALDPARYPNVLRWFASLAERPSVAAHPSPRVARRTVR